MAKINVRSPYFINIATTNLTSAKIELIIYSGAVNTSWQGSPQYTLVSTAIDAKVNFEIAELIKDYITALFDGAFPSTPVTTSEATTIYVDYRITETTTTATTVLTPVYGNRAFYGYGFFEDGANPQLDVATLQSNLTIIKNSNEVVTIPVDNEKIDKIEWLYNSAVVLTTTPLTSATIQDQILYAQNLNGGSKVNVDQIKVFQNSPSLQTITIDVTSYEKCKYTPYKLTFINKFGAYQELWMFANSKLILNTNEEKYKSNILTNGTYSTNDAQIKLLTKNGNQRLTLNSDFYPENYNVVFEELFLSEKVWIYYGAQTLGVNIESKTFNYKTSLTEGLINYTIDVSFAFDAINNIR
jgi:hypothetical protein